MIGRQQIDGGTEDRSVSLFERDFDGNGPTTPDGGGVEGPTGEYGRAESGIQHRGRPRRNEEWTSMAHESNPARTGTARKVETRARY
jgi:hypothetical protein